MLNVERIRQDFPMLNNKKMHGHPLIYFDNGATTLKPRVVVDAICQYLTDYSGNAHRGDYDLSHEVDDHFENSRACIQKFLHAQRVEEIVFTSGATDSLNMIAFGFAPTVLKSGDEILLTVAEHASNTLPWFDVAKRTGAEIKYIPLDAQGRITLENVKGAITSNTKIIALADVTNVLGYTAPVKDICDYAHQHDVYVVVDGAQSVPHNVTDVQATDIDFLVFSGHKMCGPTGIGVLYGKYDLLCQMQPIRLGGGSNARYNSCGELILKKPPYKFEPGTPNIEGVIGLGAAITYLSQIGMTAIHDYEQELRRYCIEKMQELSNVEVYNPSASGAIAFNIKDVFSQDAASLFNTYGIAVRAGQHCAKLLDNYLGVSTTLRVSFYFYNTKAEIDQFIEVCKKGDDFLYAFFG